MNERPQPGTPRGAIGGASGDAGVEYRRAVAAYAVVHGLAGVPLDGFGVPTKSAFVEGVAVETDEIVDDVAIEFADGWRANVQAKLTLSKGATFRSAMAQWRSAAQKGFGAKDRIVLVTSSMPRWGYDLKRYLDRYKSDSPGSSTKGETSAVDALIKALNGVTQTQLHQLMKHAVIHVLDAEESGQFHSREASRLLDAVVGRTDSGKAWKDLVALSGKIARMRAGFRLSGWLDLLLSDGKYTVIQTDGPTTAAAHIRTRQAMERYSELVRRRGSYIDLRTLGATIPPIPVAQVDAVIKTRAPGDDHRQTRGLLWAFLRRGRVVLTGLPGGGKSFALARLAAELLDVPSAPLPVLASLKDVDKSSQSGGFSDRLLHTAIKDLPASDRPIVRAELERRLVQGGLAVLLDSLDETHGRRRQVVVEIDSFTKSISQDVDILVATRDVAYGHAATLAWPDLRLEAPAEVKNTVGAIIEAYAGEDLTDRASWVKSRISWVMEALGRDPTLTETPLLPILLSILSASRHGEALPEIRATILHAVVKSIVERQAEGSGPDFRVGALAGELAARALLDGFASEAAIIAKSGGQCSLQRVVARLTKALKSKWGLPDGPAEVTAEVIARFWDESGVFVMSGADESIRPRVELFVEIGEAVSFARSNDRKLLRWVSDAAEAGRVEPLILAAGLSKAAARFLARTAAKTQDYSLLSATLTALRQGAFVSQSEVANLVDAVLRDIRNGDEEAWELLAEAVNTPQLAQHAGALLTAAGSFTPEHQAIARAMLWLKWNFTVNENDVESNLLRALSTRRLPKLPRRSRSTQTEPWILTIADRLHTEVVLGAAEQLLGRTDAATPLVVEELGHGPMGIQERMLELLRRRGMGHLADDYIKGFSASFRKSLAPLADFDRHGDRHLLGRLAAAPRTTLTHQQQTRLNELADFCETLNLNDISAWPRKGENQEWFFRLVTLAIKLGRFEPTVLSAQAALTLERIEASEGENPFYYLFDLARVRPLSAWSDVEDQTSTVQFLIELLFQGRGTAWVAARALHTTGEVDLALSLLRESLPYLKSSPEHEKIAALTMLSLTDGDLISEFAKDPDPVLRAVAAEHIGLTVAGSFKREVVTLLRDSDGYVVSAILKRLSDLSDPTIRAEVARIARNVNPGWTCRHCGTVNTPSSKSCTNCIFSGPDPRGKSQALLHGGPEPVDVMIDLDEVTEPSE